MAVLAVVAFHAGLPVPGGFVGVDVFFVVSGFVITAMLDREWADHGSVDFGHFYARRFKRLTPGLAIMTAVTLLLSVFILSPSDPQHTAGKTGIGAMLLLANFVIARTTGGYFDLPASVNPLLHTWSLSVEEQFYLFFPALLVLSWAIARRRSCRFATYFAVAGVAVVSFTLAVAWPDSWNLFLGFYSPFTRAWEFAIGALLALFLARRAAASHLPKQALGIAGLGLVGVSLMVIDEQVPFPGVWTALPVTGTVLLLFAGTDSQALTSRVLSSRPMVKTGNWSYSIYLWHWPFIVFASIVSGGSTLAIFAAAVVSFVPAVLSYRYIEQPIRVLGPLGKRRWSRLIAATVIPPLVVGGGLWTCAAHGWWSDPVRQLQAAAMPWHFGTMHICDARKPLSANLGQCGLNQGATGRPLYLLGDSNADHFGEGFFRAADELGMPLSIATTNACPFVDVIFKDERRYSDNEQCNRYVRETLAYLQQAPPGIVVIANSDRYWSAINDGEFFRVGDSGELSADPARKLAAFKTGLNRTVEKIAQAGHQVVLAQALPRWRDSATGRILWDPRWCTAVAALRGECVAQRSLESATADNEAVRAVIREVARQRQATVWDPAISICPGGMCSTNADTYTRYRDEGHISVPQSVHLTPDIRALIESKGKLLSPAS